MNYDEHAIKNAVCELLINEGIDGRNQDVAVYRTFQLVELATELERKDCFPIARSWLEFLDRQGIGGKPRILADYALACMIAEERFVRPWGWEQATLAQEIFLLRRAITHPEFNGLSETFRCMCLNNLGNRLHVAGRLLEALEYWRRVLDINPNFGMALYNKASTFYLYARSLFGDDGKKSLFLWMAHKEASLAIAPTAIFTAPRDSATKVAAEKLKNQIESVVDVDGITAADPLNELFNAESPCEQSYREWCLGNFLYLNASNDLGPFSRAASDCLGLAGHVVPSDAPHTFGSFYDQMKQEFVSARWLFYEGLTVKVPHFSDREVLLRLTDPEPSLCLNIEKIKAAYRAAYSLFDKIAFFINGYMRLGIPQKEVSFRRLWRSGKNAPIRSEFDQTGNWGFCALYWLSKDFFEKENEEVAEPQAQGLSEIRNHIEHKYLRVTTTNAPAQPPDDMAMTVVRSQFEGKALHLLKLARSALIYLSIGVGMEELRRQSDRGNTTIEDLPPTPVIPDESKM